MPPELREKLKAKDGARRKRSRHKLAAVFNAAHAAERCSRLQSPDAGEDRCLPPKAAIKLLHEAVSTHSDFPLGSLLRGGSAFIGPSQMRPGEGGSSHVDGDDAQAPPRLHPKCNRLVRELVEDHGFTYVRNRVECVLWKHVNTSSRPRSRLQPFVDKDGKMFAVKAKQPEGTWYQDAVEQVTQRLHKLRDQLHISSHSNARHTRGPWKRLIWGISHGGGQKVRWCFAAAVG